MGDQVGQRQPEESRTVRRPTGMRFAALFAAAVLSLMGCASEPADVTWHGDERFSEAQREKIQEGADWLYREAGLGSGANIIWDGADAKAWTIHYAPHPTAPRSAGRCDGFDGSIWFDPSFSDEFLAGMTAHEMAHCRLGFSDRYHAGEEKSEGIMRVLSPMRWTSNEDEQCAESTSCRRCK